MNDIKNPLEKIKVDAALQSECKKLELRKAYKPETISILDYTIIAALEKQIPKAVIPYNSAKDHNFIECSVCNGHLDLYYKYCTECGQKLRD